MKLNTLHTSCTVMTPRGLNAHHLAEVSHTESSAPPAPDHGDQVKLSPAARSWQVDFNTIKQSKHVFKTVANGIKANGFKQAGNHLKTFSRGVGVVGHSGRAYEKYQKGKYLDAGKESARAIKDGARMVKKALPAGVTHGLNLVITAAVADKYYDYLLKTLENPSHENVDRLVAHSKLVVQNVDDVYELGKFLVAFARKKGPDFVGRLETALADKHPVVANEGVSLTQITNQIIAGLDVGRAVLSGIEVAKDPLNDYKLGQAIKRSVVAGLSIAAAQKQASWIPNAVALGSDLAPDALYTYIAGEARAHYNSY